MHAPLPPVDVAATIARIKAADSEVKAWRAFSSINASNGSPDNDVSQSHQPLQNFTVGVKDIIDVAGLSTRMGSAIFADAPPATQDAAVVALMKKAGAIIIGKTITTELATFVPAATRNPLNLNHTPGGSSSGSAAAVAAGHVTIAIGTQTAGSILRPAAYCGVFGFKPSVGLVPTDGVLVQSPTLDTVGVFARSVEDCAAWLAAMTGKPIDLATSGTLKIGIITNWLEHASDEVRRALQDVQANLNKAGHHARHLTLPTPLANMPMTQKIIQDVESACAYADLRQHHRTELTPALANVLDAGAAINEETYQDALRAIADAQPIAAALFDAYDIWLMPAAASAAPRGWDSTGDPVFNRLASGLGLPAISLPLSSSQGNLALGLQIIGGPRADVALLSSSNTIARCLSTITSPPRPQ